ncbi:MAG: flagellar biosynthetic protein FliP [Candidatus Neomarinimicrobiota bacterium]|nr:flagellar type III secretion system pore protein FliP [Candidatus Neomarinimicrobiota bacterium]MCD6100790.1 flagellar type III secretion system pore protein FliP [Candidatus Neomarinimicrobiota bacterium]RKY49581.1 MAG: flagellar biosynthetic protein FliP [Candidatus Neomarinimicrobiota bacterium]
MFRKLKGDGKVILVLMLLMVAPVVLHGQVGIPKITIGIEEAKKPEDFVLAIRIVLLLTILSLAPSILIMMTSFTRLIVVFHFIRTSLATQTAPPNQILIGLALFITFFIMKPVLNEINASAIQPYINGEITQKEAIDNAIKPLKKFMLKQTRPKDLELFLDLRGEGRPATPDELALSTVVPAFIISELKTAFQIGFLLYLPMLLIDMVIASTLLSLGMMMLPPIMISMPFKIMLFVLVDGWHLIVESMVKGFIQ